MKNELVTRYTITAWCRCCNVISVYSEPKYRHCLYYRLTSLIWWTIMWINNKNSGRFFGFIWWSKVFAVKFSNWMELGTCWQRCKNPRTHQNEFHAFNASLTSWRRFLLLEDDICWTSSCIVNDIDYIACIYWAVELYIHTFCVR